MTLLTYNKICILFGCRRGWTLFFFSSCISGCHFPDPETSSQKGFRDYLLPFLVCFVFHALARLSVARHFFPTLHCVFLLASRLSQRNQKISLPALSTSSIFYDPSICNLMVVEFPLPTLTLGRVPLGYSETHGQSLQSSLALFGASDRTPCILLCVSWPSVRTLGSGLFSPVVRQGVRSMKMWRAELLGILKS